jgi:hypothetical protein
MAVVTKTYCDVCSSETELGRKHIPVRFVTNQTDGDFSTPHLSMELLDICDGCMKQLVDGLPLEGAGAQGHNRYEWRK